MTRKALCLVWFAAALTCRVSLAAATQAATQPAAAAYKGWVHVATPGRPTLDFNTEMLICVVRGPTANISAGLPAEIEQFVRSQTAGINVQFMRLKELEMAEYRDGVLTTRLMDPREVGLTDEDTARLPVTAEALLDELREAFGAAAVGVTTSTDRAMERYDIETPKPATRPAANPFDQSSRPPLHSKVFGGIPTAIWADPQTHRIRELLINGKTVAVTYGAPEFATIYDAGVPRDVKVVDLHPTPEALAVWKRVQARAEKPFPDGVMVQNGKTTAEYASICGRAGANWEMRSYPVSDEPEERHLQFPEEWSGAAADEFFRRLTAPCSVVQGGDGTRAWEYQIDPKTGEHFVSTAQVAMDANGATSSFKEYRAKPMEFTGRMAQEREQESTFMTEFYPHEAAKGLGGGNAKLDLATSKDRPGLVALRVRVNQTIRGGKPNASPEITEEWIDPAHDDRPVVTVTTTYRDYALRDVMRLEVKEFGDFATLPQPDGRSYPTTIIVRDFHRNPNGAMEENAAHEVGTYHFFPGRKLPDMGMPSMKPALP